MELLGTESLSKWSVRTLTDQQTRYDARTEGGTFVLHATSRNSASFFMRHVTFSPTAFPWLKWDWRVTRPVRGEDLSKKSGNDCSARLLVGFKGDWSDAGYLERRAVRREIEATGYEPPGTMLVYVWSLSAPEGTLLTDPHVGPRAKMIVATAGAGALGVWQHVCRNVEDDYRKAFGCEPPAVVSLALLSDTDDTHSESESDYGAIVAKSSRDSAPKTEPLAVRDLIPAPRVEHDEQPQRRPPVAPAILLGAAICALLLVFCLCRRRRHCGLDSASAARREA